MKKFKNIGVMLAAVSLFFVGCDKENVVDRAAEGEIVGAKIRLYNFAIGGPTVNFYSNEVKISAVGSSNALEALGGVVYGGEYPSNQYALAPAGNRNILAITPMNLAVNGAVTTATIPADLADGKFYSIYTSGIYNTVDKKSEGFYVEDVFPQTIDTAGAYVRIVNPCPNSSIRLLLQKTQTVAGVKTIIEEVEVGSDVEYQKASPFLLIKPGAWELVLTDKNSGKTATRAATGFLKQRVYTLSLRGNIVTGSPAAFIDFTTNK